MKLLIIEGVVASGKTSVFKNLQALLSEHKPNVSKFFITEHLSQRIFEHIDDAKAKKVHVQKHVRAMVEFIRYLTRIHDSSKFKNRKTEFLIICVERFLLSYLVDRLIDDKFAADILSQLALESPIQFLLTVPKNQMLRRIESTLNFRNDRWKDYLYELSSRINVGNHFNAQQKRMKDWAVKFSRKMTTHCMDTAEEDYEEYAMKILESL
ncbi:MAG: hypothetical protein QNJ27_03820 [Simkaniaceae bacterium]|nr:hypothetical protein [Simkaniaceae bacterium]